MSDDRRPKILLSLDGGGIKGWSQLVILDEIIRRVKNKIKENAGHHSLVADEDLKESQIYPCEYFDLIVGSGTGGINAILIGRLGLSIKECIEAWEGLDKVYKLDYDCPDDGSLFSAEKLEEWAKDLVEKHTGNPETMMLIKNDAEKPNNNGKSCRVGVTSMRSQNIGFPAIFRSYRVYANAGIDCAIWEVLRATTAAPLLFKSVFIGRKWANEEFINTELGANNPISYLYQEKQNVWDNWPPPDTGCIISVGCGKYSTISLPLEPKPQTGWTRWFRSKPDFDLAEKLHGVMLRIAKDCERKHQEIQDSYIYGPQGGKVYYRLNVEQGMQDLPESSYDEETRARMLNLVTSYLAHGEFGIYVEDLIDKIVEVLGTVEPGEVETVPAYEPPVSQNQATVEKAKGVASRKLQEILSEVDRPLDIIQRHSIRNPMSNEERAVDLILEAYSQAADGLRKKVGMQAPENGQMASTDTVAASPTTGVVDSHSDKDILPFLRIPYLRAQRNLQLARKCHRFHSVIIHIARQALHLVSLLNDHVYAYGLAEDQLDEAITLRGELLQFGDAIQMWRSWGSSEDLQSPRDQLLTEIKEHYDRFFSSRPTCCFERDPESDRTYDRLVAYDIKEMSVWGDPNSQENLEEEAAMVDQNVTFG